MQCPGVQNKHEPVWSSLPTDVFQPWVRSYVVIQCDLAHCSSDFGRKRADHGDQDFDHFRYIFGVEEPVLMIADAYSINATIKPHRRTHLSSLVLDRDCVGVK